MTCAQTPRHQSLQSHANICERGKRTARKRHQRPGPRGGVHQWRITPATGDVRPGGGAAQSQTNIALFKSKLAEWRSEMPDVFLCSSKTKHGRMDILTAIEASLTNRNRASG